MCPKMYCNLMKGRGYVLHVFLAVYHAHLMHNNCFVNLVYYSFSELLSVKLIALVSLFF